MIFSARSSVARAPAWWLVDLIGWLSRKTSKRVVSPDSEDTYNLGQGQGVETVSHTREVAGSSPDRADHFSPRVAQRSEHRSDRPGVGAFNSSPVDHFPVSWPQLIWGQALGPPECPYLTRWVLDFGAFALRFHKWSNSDDLRHPHDHPWDYWTLVLWGTMTEHTEYGTWERKAGSLWWFDANFRHCVEVNSPAYTILLTGPEIRPQWGFWVDGKFRKRNKYFHEHGHHHPCDPTQNKVRRQDIGKTLPTYAEQSRDRT